MIWLAVDGTNWIHQLWYPNKRQLQAWCEEWGIWDQVREWKTLSAQAEGVIELHCGEGKGLRVLKALAKQALAKQE